MRAPDAFLDLARGALGELVDGAHFLDVVDENTVYERNNSECEPKLDGKRLQDFPRPGFR